MTSPSGERAAMSEPSWRRVVAAIEGAPPNVQTGVSIRDFRSEASFGHEEHRVFPAASTIKLVILIALARAFDEGRLRPQDKVPVLAPQKVGGSGVLNWLETGLELSLHDHAWLLTAISDNTASNVLIDALGLPAIHEVQRSLGLRSTSLNRRFFGRSPERCEPVNLACAGDLVNVLAAIEDGSAASPEQCAWMLKVLGDQQVTDRLARHLPEGISFAGKSGWVTGISHDAGLLRGLGGVAAVAVLTEGSDDPHAAKAFIGTIGVAVVADLGLA